jgi:hypothetical protein
LAKNSRTQISKIRKAKIQLVWCFSFSCCVFGGLVAFFGFFQGLMRFERLPFHRTHEKMDLLNVNSDTTWLSKKKKKKRK